MNTLLAQITGFVCPEAQHFFQSFSNAGLVEQIGRIAYPCADELVQAIEENISPSTKTLISIVALVIAPILVPRPAPRPIEPARVCTRQMDDAMRALFSDASTPILHKLAWIRRTLEIEDVSFFHEYILANRGELGRSAKDMLRQVQRPSKKRIFRKLAKLERSLSSLPAHWLTNIQFFFPSLPTQDNLNNNALPLAWRVDRFVRLMTYYQCLRIEYIAKSHLSVQQQVNVIHSLLKPHQFMVTLPV